MILQVSVVSPPPPSIIKPIILVDSTPLGTCILPYQLPELPAEHITLILVLVILFDKSLLYNNDLGVKVNNFTEKTTFNINESGLYDVYAIGPAANYATHYTVINHVVGSGYITQSILSLSKATLYSRTCFNGTWSDFLIVPNMEYLNILTAVSTDSTKGTLVHFDDTKGKAFMLIDGQPWYFSVSRT